MITFRFGIIILVVNALAGTPAQAQSGEADSLWTVELPVMVVTASRTMQRLRDTPVPARVVSRSDLTRSGGLRLSDALNDEPGITMVNAFGTGIQLQGLDPAYTLILLDGQPLIGRTAGTLDLGRIPVAGIERVEIVQGPSSSLYGSEALAGVVNIISARPDPGVRLQTSARAQSFGTRDLNARLSGGRGAWTSSASYNHVETDGYDLSPDVAGNTGPGYISRTGNVELDFDPTANWSARVTGRMARTRRADTIGFNENGVQFTFEEDDLQEDVSLSPSITIRPTPSHRVQIQGHATTYRTRSALTDDAGSSLTRFRQGMQRAEVMYDFLGSRSQLVTGGTGYTRETVRADRILGDSRSMRTFHAFVQHQWLPESRVSTTVSGRLDVHSEYGVHGSPKAAVQVNPSERVRFQLSVGTGFKSPTFQQLYMDFTNPVAGYSVIGAADAGAALDSLAAIGQVRTLLTDPSAFQAVSPEQSVSYNAAVSWSVTPAIDVSVSAFWNNIRDLIETLPVATKPNGQNIFTYLNLNRIRTRGLTVDISGKPSPRVSWRLGWNGLDTADKDVLADLDAGRLFTREDGVDRRLERHDYGGLFNRSRHSITMALSLDRLFFATNVHIRGQYRSRYGFGDRNGNLILDAENEYVPGYWLWNITLDRPVGRQLRATAGIRNLINHTNPTQNPALPGRQFFAGMALDITP